MTSITGTIGFEMVEVDPSRTKPANIAALRSVIADKKLLPPLDPNQVDAVMSSLVAELTDFAIAKLSRERGTTPEKAIAYIARVDRAAESLATLMDECATPEGDAVLRLVDQRLSASKSAPGTEKPLAVTRSVIRELATLRHGLALAKAKIGEPKQGGSRYQHHERLVEGVIDKFQKHGLPTTTSTRERLVWALVPIFEAAGLHHNNPTVIARRVLQK